MATIRLETTPVVIGIDTGYDHLYLVYEDSGREFVIRGGPTDTLPPFGSILLEVGVPIQRSVDARPNTSEAREERGSIVLDLGGRDAEAVWNGMISAALDIQNSNVPYDIDFLEAGAQATQNSNSTIAAVAARVGIDINSYLPLKADDDYIGSANTIDQVEYFLSANTNCPYSEVLEQIVV